MTVKNKDAEDSYWYVVLIFLPERSKALRLGKNRKDNFNFYKSRYNDIQLLVHIPLGNSRIELAVEPKKIFFDKLFGSTVEPYSSVVDQLVKSSLRIRIQWVWVRIPYPTFIFLISLHALLATYGLKHMVIWKTTRECDQMVTWFCNQLVYMFKSSIR